MSVPYSPVESCTADYGAAACRQDQDVAPGIVEEIAHALEALDTWVTRYEQRLAVVARPEYEGPQTSAVCEPAPLVSSARHQLNRIHGLTTRLVTLNDRLEL